MFILFPLHCFQDHREVSHFDCISGRSHFQIMLRITVDEAIKESL